MKGLRNFAVWLLVFGLVGVYSQHHEKSVAEDLEIQEHSNSQKDFGTFENKISKVATDHVLKRLRRREPVNNGFAITRSPTRPPGGQQQQPHRERAQPVNADDRESAARARGHAGAGRQTNNRGGRQ